MDNGRVSSWVQIVGNFAVLVGIAVLIYEVDQNRQMTNVQVLQAEMVPIEARLIALMGEDPRSALFKAEFCPDELTGEEAVTLSAYYTTFAIGWFTVYQADQSGGFERNWHNVVTANIEQNFSSSVSRRWAREFLTSGSAILSPEIREVVELALSAAESGKQGNLYSAILSRDSDTPNCSNLVSRELVLTNEEE